MTVVKDSADLHQKRVETIVPLNSYTVEYRWSEVDFCDLVQSAKQSRTFRPKPRIQILPPGNPAQCRFDDLVVKDIVAKFVIHAVNSRTDHEHPLNCKRQIKLTSGS